MSNYLSFETFNRSSKPNNYLLAPEGLCQNADPDQFSPLIQESPDVLFRRLVDLFETSKGWKTLEYNKEKRCLHVVAVTSLMRYKDDVDIRVVGEQGLDAGQSGSRLAVYSRSRVGYSDLGANKKRVEALLAKCLAG